MWRSIRPLCQCSDPSGTGAGLSTVYLTGNSLLKRVSACMSARSGRRDCALRRDIHISDFFFFGCVWPLSRAAGLLLDDSSAGRVSATVFHKYTPLSTGWKSNTNMTGGERGRGSEKIYVVKGTRSCAQTAEGSRTFSAKTTFIWRAARWEVQYTHRLMFKCISEGGRE